MIKKQDILLAASSGILLILGFPQFDLYPLSWVALAPLLIALRGKNMKASFYLGFLAGSIYFMGTIYWVYHSMYYYGGLPFALSILLMVLLSLSQALYVAGFSMLFSFLSKKPALPALLTAPALWVTMEYIRTYTIFSFPWSTLGYSQYKFLPIIQISDITGVYGISFLVAACSGMICDALTLLSRKTGEKNLAGKWPHIAGIIIFVILFSFSLHYGTGKMRAPDTGGKIRTAIIQGNIEQGIKWDKRFQRDVIDTFKRLSITSLSEHPDIILWPESALPFIFGYDKPLTEEIIAFQKELNTHLLFGSMLTKGEGASRLSNSAVLLSPGRDTPQVYDKIHLVPYGEYVPLRELFPFVGKMVAAIGDFVRGQETNVMETPFAEIGNLICYEIIFPGLVRQFADNGANMLVTITNDAWFGYTAAPYQHFSMAVFRAVENRVPVARAANTGISGFIDSKGRIMEQSDIFTETIMIGDIRTGTEKSFYAEYGDIFVWICIALSIVLVAGSFRLKARM